MQAGFQPARHVKGRCCHSCSTPVSPPISMMTAASSTGDAALPEEVHGEVVEKDGKSVEGPVVKALPEVYQPTAEELAKHCLTHLPYRRWCKWCVAARMANFPHWTMPPFSRECPLLVMDYCFLKHPGEDAFLTVLVGRTYPSRAIFACPCSAKGPDPYATRRLAAFLRSCGMLNFTYMCGQESALRTMIDESVQVAKGMG